MERMQRWTSTFHHPKGYRFIIEYTEEPPEYMLYLYEHPALYEEEIAENNIGCPLHQDDYNQDTFEASTREALRLYGVPMDSWVEVESGKG